MAGFFDKLGDAVSRGARQVSDTTRGGMEKMRLRNEMKSMESELHNRFRDIGEKFFTETQGNPNPDYAELFAAITELQNNIAQKRHELEALEGVVACPGCGRSIPRESRFCPACGAPAPAAAPAQDATRPAAVCPNCGTSLAPGAQFCAACGTSVAQTPPPAAPTQPTACANCGTTLAPGAMFCPTCGSAVPGVR